MTSIEEKILEEVTPNYLDVLDKEKGYVENFGAFVSEIEAEKDPVKRIELINEKYNKVYFMNEKGYLTFLRGNEYALLTSIEKLLAESPVPAEPEVLEIEKPKPPKEVLEEETCFTKEGCQQLLGEKIIEIAETEKVSRGVNDISVKQDTGAESFECLALQVVYTESRIKHCRNIQENGDPLYCEEDANKLIVGDSVNYTLREIPPIYEFLGIDITDKSRVPGSTGIMQIHLPTHGDTLIQRNIDIADFEENVNYGIDLLIDNYDSSEKIYRCYRQVESSVVRESDFVNKVYSGWQRALREYNGWNTQCTYIDEEGVRRAVGNPNYVEDVISYKDEVKALFPEVCGS